MRDVFLKTIAVLIGSYGLVDVWAGFIACCISSIVVLYAHYGNRMFCLIKLTDLFFWLFGSFVLMRSSTFIVNLINHNAFRKEKGLDIVIVGFACGIINSWFFIKNYKPILDFLNKYLGKKTK